MYGAPWKTLLLPHAGTRIVRSSQFVLEPIAMPLELYALGVAGLALFGIFLYRQVGVKPRVCRVPQRRH